MRHIFNAHCTSIVIWSLHLVTCGATFWKCFSRRIYKKNFWKTSRSWLLRAGCWLWSFSWLNSSLIIFSPSRQRRRLPCQPLPKHVEVITSSSEMPLERRIQSVQDKRHPKIYTVRYRRACVWNIGIGTACNWNATVNNEIFNVAENKKSIINTCSRIDLLIRKMRRRVVLR